MRTHFIIFFFFFNDTATTEIYTLSLHDALPTSGVPLKYSYFSTAASSRWRLYRPARRSEEHTSELQSRLHLVCRLLLEKKKKNPLHRCLSSSARRSRFRPKAAALPEIQPCAMTR